MKKFTLSIIILVAGLFISQNLSSQNSSLANIDEFILANMSTFHVPGLSAVIIKGDSVVWNNNYGHMNLQNSIPVNDSTLFSVFSIGKSITAACIMQLWDDGLLELDQNINEFLPFQLVNPWNSADSITARMLMSHSSSVNNGNIYSYVSVGDPTIELGFFLENFLSAGGIYYNNSNYWNMQPGTQFHYDNYGVALNGYLIEPLTGIAFSQYAQDSLLAPLEMDKSAWFLAELNVNNLATGYTWSGGNYTPVPNYGHPAYPGLSLRSTALELANYTIMLLNDGNFKELTVLSDAAVDSMATLQNPNWNFSYGRPGLGLFKRTDYGNRTVWGHNGGSDGGYANHFYFCKEENSGIVITTNSEQYVDPIVLQLFEYAGLFTIANPGTDITSSGFTAIWEPAATATGYLLDIAFDDEFVNFVNGYENMNVGFATSYTVTGIEPETEYFYRLRAFNIADTGAYSNVISLTTFSTSCLPEGITFTTQSEIDNFQTNYPGCTEIEGNVTINGGDITNLIGLNVLTSIGLDLNIIGNDALTSMTGLENLSSVGHFLKIQGNDALTCLSGLNNLISCFALFIDFNDALTSLTGLENLTTTGSYCSISHNNSLTNLIGLDNLNSVWGMLYIAQNNALVDLTGLEALNNSQATIAIDGNNALTSLTGLNNLTTTFGLSIGCNPLLSNLNGLGNLTSVGAGGLTINFSELISLTGLEGLNEVEGSLIIGQDIEGEGGNPSLMSLAGLDNIDAGSITGLIIMKNFLLSNCDVQSICDYLAVPGSNVEIWDNAPGCNSPEEVQEACLTLIEDHSNDFEFTISPNPVSGYSEISINLRGSLPVEICLYNTTGICVKRWQYLQSQIGKNIFILDLKGIPDGIYFCRVQIGNEMVTKKIIKL